MERGGWLGRVTSTVVKLITKEGKSTTLKLSSGDVCLIIKNCPTLFEQAEMLG